MNDEMVFGLVFLVCEVILGGRKEKEVFFFGYGGPFEI